MNIKRSCNGKFSVPLIILIFVLSGASVYGLNANDSENTFMSVNKTANVSTAEVGDVIEYKIVIKNEGNATLNNVTVEDTLPYGVRYVNGSKYIVCAGDATPPTVENSSAPDIYIGEDAVIRVDVYDASDVDTVIVEVDGTANYTMEYTGSGNTYAKTISGLGPGTHYIRYYANDTKGNLNDSVTDLFNVYSIPQRGGGGGSGSSPVPTWPVNETGDYPETIYEVYLKPALLDKNLTEIYQTPALWDERIIEIYQTPVLWNESKITLFDIYGNLMFPEYLPLYAIDNMSPQEVCTITYRAEVFLCHPNATNYANVTVKNSNNESIVNASDSAIVDIPCPLPDFTITNMSIPVIKEIKEVIIPYKTNERNETLTFSALVFINKTQVGNKRTIYFNAENLEYLPYTNFDTLNITLYDNDNYYNSLIKNFTNIVKITNISFNWTPTTHGWHNLTIVIDPKNVIQESNKSNNNMTLEIEVVLPDLIITNMSVPVVETIKEFVIPYGSNERNEISNTSRLVIANKTPLGGKRIIYFYIKNLEEPPFPELSNVTLSMYDNGNYYTSITRNLTNAFEYYNLSMEWIPITPGWHNLTIIIDPDNEIQESDKSNNNIALEIEVLLPDLTITNISMPIIKEIKKIVVPYNSSQIVSLEFIIAHNTTINQERIIYADIKNLEEMQFSYLDNVSIALYDNNDYYALKLLNLSNIFEFFNLDFNWTPTYTGVHNLTCIADIHNETNESDEHNNNMSISIDVLPVPAQDFRIITMNAIKAGGNRSISEALLNCENNSIYMDIENLAEPPYLDIGNVNISLLIFDKNNTLIHNDAKTRDLTDVWKIINLNFSWFPLNEGVYNITAVIDSNNLINETNEFNNNFTITVDVNYSVNNTCDNANVLDNSTKLDTRTSRKSGGGGGSSNSITFKKICGNTLCEENETCENCPVDCGNCSVEVEPKNESNEYKSEPTVSTCPDSCDDNNKCTRDYCSEKTNYTCKHTPIIPCCGNNICEKEENCTYCPDDCKKCKLNVNCNNKAVAGEVIVCVVNDNKNNPLPNVTVKISTIDNTIIKTTDENGKINFIAENSGIIDMTFEKSHYNSEKINVSISTNPEKNKFFDFIVENKFELLSILIILLLFLLFIKKKKV